MRKIHLEIIENESTNSELLSDYWRFEDEMKFNFTFTAKFLINKYNLESYEQLSERVNKAGVILIKKLKDCKKCYENIFFYNRAQFKNLKKYILKDDVICNECKSKINIERVKKIIYEIEEHACRENNENFKLLELNYLEKIILYILIENYKESKLKNWNALHIFNSNGNNLVVRKIIQKGYIKEVISCSVCNSKQVELRSIFMRNKEIFNVELSNKIEYFFKKNYEYYCKIIMPKEFDNWSVEIYSDIVNQNIKVDDIKEIEEFILNQRFDDVYRLINLICEENSITWNKNNAFDYEVFRMIKNYNLEVIYYNLINCARDATSKLYLIEKSSGENSNYYKNEIYRYEVSSKIDRLEKYDKNKLYSKSLPYSWTQSEVELFINTYIIGGIIKWDKLTPKEILNIILSNRSIGD